MTINRDEFEEWLELHKDEALGRIEGEYYTLGRWISLFHQGLIVELHEDGGEPDPSPRSELDFAG